MTTRENNKYKPILKRKLENLGVPLSKREDIAVERKAEIAEVIQDEGTRRVTIHTLNADSQLIKQVRAALRRIANHTFGECTDCGRPIAVKRLDAVPWAECCVICQEEREQEAAGNDHQEDTRQGKWDYTVGLYM